MPVDFPLAVKACLAAGYGQWNLPASYLFWALLKKKKKNPQGWNWSHFLHTVCWVLIQIQGGASISFTEFAERQKRLKFPNCQRSGIWKPSAKSSRLKMDLFATFPACICSRPGKKAPVAPIFDSFSLVRRSLCARSCIVKAAYDSSMETLIV